MERAKNRWVRMLVQTGAALVVALPAFLLAGSASAESALLRPNRDIALPSTTADEEPSLSGAVVHDALTPFSIRDADGEVLCRGTLQDRVVRSTATGRLDFSYRIRDTSGPGEIVGVAANGYAFETLRVAYRTDGLGTEAPTRAFRHPTPGSRVVVGGMRLSCGRHEESRFILIRTQARLYNTAGSAEIVLSSGETATVDTASPR